MSDTVVDSSVAAKWVLPETDSPQALQLISEIALKAERLIVLDLALVEVSNAIWVQFHRGLISAVEARDYLQAFRRLPVHVEPAGPLLDSALDIAIKYDRALYDTLFIALARDLGLRGVTADEPLQKAVAADFPQIVLLRDWSP